MSGFEGGGRRRIGEWPREWLAIRLSSKRAYLLPSITVESLLWSLVEPEARQLPAPQAHTQVHCPFLHSLSLFTSSIANLSWATCSQVKLKLSDSQRGARGVALAASPAPSRISSGQVLHRRRASFSMRAPTRPDPMIVLFCLFANCQKRRQAKLTAAGTARCTDELYDNVFNSSATTFAL